MSYLVLFASLQVRYLKLVQEPALVLSMSGVVVPDTQERQRSEAALRAEYEVHDTSGCQLLHNEAFQTAGKRWWTNVGNKTNDYYVRNFQGYPR